MFAAIVLLRRRERHERDLTRALDRDRQLALLLRREARDAARNDLAALGDEELELLGVLVVEVEVRLEDERRRLLALAAAAQAERIVTCHRRRVAVAATAAVVAVAIVFE